MFSFSSMSVGQPSWGLPVIAVGSRLSMTGVCWLRRAMFPHHQAMEFLLLPGSYLVCAAPPCAWWWGGLICSRWYCGMLSVGGLGLERSSPCGMARYTRLSGWGLKVTLVVFVCCELICWSLLFAVFTKGQGGHMACS